MRVCDCFYNIDLSAILIFTGQFNSLMFRNAMNVLSAGHAATDGPQTQQKESRVQLMMTSQSRRHARHSDVDVDVTQSSAVTFKSAASYVVTRIQLYATYSIYFKVISTSHYASIRESSEAPNMRTSIRTKISCRTGTSDFPGVYNTFTS